MGRTLGLALALLALPGSVRVAQGDVASDWRLEWEALRSGLENEDPLLRESALLELREWFEQRTKSLAELGRVLSAPGQLLASRSDWTPDLDERLALWERVASTAAAGGFWDDAARFATVRAQLLRRAGRLDEALADLEASLARFPAARRARPYQLLKLAEWSRERNALGAAQRWLRRFREAFGDGALTDDLRFAHSLLEAQIAIDLGLADVAEREARRALELARERQQAGSGRILELLQARRTLVNLAKSRGDHEGVERLASSFLVDEESYAQHPGERAQLLALRGTSLLQGGPHPLERTQGTGKIHAADDGARMVREALESGLPGSFALYARAALAEYAALQADWDAARQELGAARAALDARLREGAVVGLQERADLATLEVRLALDEGRPREELERLRPVLDDALEQLRRAWLELEQREGGVAFLLYGRRRSVLGEWIRLGIALDGREQGALRGLEKVLAIQEQGSLARSERAKAPSVAQLRQRLLGPAGGMLVYLRADLVSHLFLVDASRVSWIPLGDGALLERARRAWWQHLDVAADEVLGGGPAADALLERERQLARELSDLLLPREALDQMSSWKQVTIVGGDTLGPVPFAWLPLEVEGKAWTGSVEGPAARSSGRRDSQYVGDTPDFGTAFALTELPSVPLGFSRARVEPPLPRPMDAILIAAQPSASARALEPELPELDYAEVSGLLEAHASERRTFVLGPAASFGGIAALSMEGAGVVQFLGHALQDLTRERSTALALAAGTRPDGTAHDGLLRYEDVAALGAPSLVLLTACRSGDGALRRGDPGTTDLAGAWIARGADAVAVTHRDLTLRDAKQLSAGVHAALVDGASPAEALRLRRRALRSREGLRAPWRDGMLHLVGLGHRVVFSREVETDQHVQTAFAEQGTVQGAGRSGRWGLVAGALLSGMALGFFVARNRKRPAES